MRLNRSLQRFRDKIGFGFGDLPLSLQLMYQQRDKGLGDQGLAAILDAVFGRVDVVQDSYAQQDGAREKVSWTKLGRKDHLNFE